MRPTLKYLLFSLSKIRHSGVQKLINGALKKANTTPRNYLSFKNYPHDCPKINKTATRIKMVNKKNQICLLGCTTIILHGSTSQKTNLNFILAAVRT
jgi:hypothetical protein